MDAQICVTYKCGTACKTCNTWMLEGTMPIERFREVWDKLNEAHEVTRFIMNALGDINVLPNAEEYLQYMEQNHKKRIVFTTNAKVIPYVPTFDVYVCSFNGGTKEAYEFTTGLPFEKVRDNIRALYPAFMDRLRKGGMNELHMVVWSGNKGTEKEFGELWSDFPGRVRLNYRATNIPAKWASDAEKAAPEGQRYCDNLDALAVMPNGDVELCFCGYSTDFTGLKAAPTYGNIFKDSVAAMMMAAERTRYRAEHCKGIYRAPCDKCNYNTTLQGKIIYLRDIPQLRAEGLI